MDEQMERWMRKDVGKSCFVNCFEVALEKGENFTEDDVVENHDNLQTDDEITPLSKHNRAKGIREIFEAGRECEALRECCKNKIFPDSAVKARRLYDEYCKAR